MTEHQTGWLNTWLSQPWPGGLILVGGCSADGKPFCQALGENPATRVSDECWLALNEVVAQLAAYGWPRGDSVWTFESAVMWVASRDDGAWAGVLAPPELPEGFQSAAKSRLAEFMSPVG